MDTFQYYAAFTKKLEEPIPGEATRGSSVISEGHFTQDSAKGGKCGKRIEPANQTSITSASGPTVSPGKDGEEEE
jgi:hypothetical protein